MGGHNDATENKAYLKWPEDAPNIYVPRYS